MKRTLIAVLFCFFCLAAATKVNAGNFGVTGGISLMGLKNASLEAATGYHAGFTYKFRLPVGFAVQPSLLYNAKMSRSAAGDVKADLNVGYLELPVSLQWGPDLLLFRPFLDVSPFIGYGLNHKLDFQGFDADGGQTYLIQDNWGRMNRLEYGLGLGAGLEVWKFQIVCRYNWNFGPLLNNEGKVDASSLLNKTLNDSNFSGVTLSLALLF